MNATYHPLIRIRYDAAGRTHEIWTYSLNNVTSADRKKPQAIVDRYQIGSQYPCWYDPQSPGHAVLNLQSSGPRWGFLLLGLLCGIFAISFTGISMVAFALLRGRLRPLGDSQPAKS